MKMGSATISLPDGTLQSVSILYDTSRNSYRLEWKDERPVLSVPRGTTYPEVESLLKKHRRWIGRRKSEREQLRTLDIDPPSEKGFPFGGIVFHAERSREKNRTVTADFKKRKILVPGGIDGRSSIEAIRLWILEQFIHQISGSLQIWSDRTGLRPNRIHIRATRSQWGSMSSGGGLSLSWYLFAYPFRALHYIILHELVHLRFRNHSCAFWKKVESHFPEYQNARGDLKASIDCPSWLLALPEGKRQIAVPWEPAKERGISAGPVEESGRIVLL